jgi:hypothetical protein
LFCARKGKSKANYFQASELRKLGLANPGTLPAETMRLSRY